MNKFYMAGRLKQPDQVIVGSYQSNDPNAKVMTRAEAKAVLQDGGLAGPITFVADVYGTGPNKNHTRLNEDELGIFAESFVGQPFLKDHSHEQDARGGTIRKSELIDDGGRQVIRQMIEVVKPWAIEGYLDGTIDRFSIGWDAEQYLCTVCNKDFFDDETKHTPWDLGKKDKESGKVVEVLMKGLEGDETSVVTHPAVSGTGIREQLAQACELRKGKGKDELVGELDIRIGNSSGIQPAQNREEGMKQQIASLLNLPPETAEEQLVEELKKRLSSSPAAVPEDMLKALGLKPTASVDEATLAVVKVTAPGYMVPRTQYEAVLIRANKAEAASAIAQGEKEGKITPGNLAWFEKLAGENPDMFKSYIAEAPVQIPGQKPFTAELTAAKPSDPGDSGELTPEDLIVLRQSSFTKEEFLEAKKLGFGQEARMAQRIRAKQGVN